jgi:pyruvate/2-oxoglutarate dehydrogenase complex dihydrolipoamide acyltransferase (E2) component
MANVELVRKKDLTSFRKIAIGTWNTVGDPSVYGTILLRMDRAMQYLADFRAKTGRKLTVSHLMAKAVAAALKKCPDANSMLRFSRIYLRKQINIFFQVVLADEGADKVDLSGATLEDVDKKSLVTIYDEFAKKIEAVRARKDKALEKTRSMFGSMPGWLVKPLLNLVSFLSYTLNIRLPGTPKDAFGGIMITNIGTLGLEEAYVPLVPYAKVPMLLAVGAVKEEPIVENGQIVIGKVMRVNATFDHRFIDGFHAAIMSKILREHFENPYEHFDKLEEVVDAVEVQPAV